MSLRSTVTGVRAVVGVSFLHERKGGEVYALTVVALVVRVHRHVRPHSPSSVRVCRRTRETARPRISVQPHCPANEDGNAPVRTGPSPRSRVREPCASFIEPREQAARTASTTISAESTVSRQPKSPHEKPFHRLTD